MRARDILIAALPTALPDFLPARRWFAGKARTIASTTVEDIAWLPGSADVALVLVRVHYDTGPADRYALLTAIVADPGDLPMIAASGDAGMIVEAAGAPFAVGALASTFVAAANGREAALVTENGGRLEIADVVPNGIVPSDVRADGIRPLDAEQSNSSVRIGRRLLLKLIRVVADGENPEVEVGRQLTAAGFDATPALRGSLTHRSGDGTRRTVVVLQEWRDNQGDGWTYVVEQLRAGADAVALTRDVRVLGATTARMHAALAATTDAAFTPEPATPADVAQWMAALTAGGARVAARLLAVRRTLPESTRALVDDVGDLDAAARRVAAHRALAVATDFAKIRVHGDYHLGQTLRVRDRFLVIDLEGEPARPLAERRAKHCALKDVAGMLRSFGYAVAVAGCAARDLDDPVETPLRDAFLQGYLDAAGDAPFLPRTADARRALLEMFELGKALYEVEYELDHRPDWSEIPLRAVVRLTRTLMR